MGDEHVKMVTVFIPVLIAFAVGGLVGGFVGYSTACVVYREFVSFLIQRCTERKDDSHELKKPHDDDADWWKGP